MPFQALPWLYRPNNVGILVARTTVHATLTDSQASRAYLNNRAAPIVRTSGIRSAVLVMCRLNVPIMSRIAEAMMAR